MSRAFVGTFAAGGRDPTDMFCEDQLFEIFLAAAFGAAHERLAGARRALEDA